MSSQLPNHVLPLTSGHKNLLRPV